MKMRTGLLLAAGLLAAACVPGCAKKTYRCPTSAMLPTMGPDDIFAAERDPYRDRAPARGDVIVFEVPESAPPNFRGSSVKRLIGLPGDRIALAGYRVVANGDTLDEPYIAIPPEDQRRTGGSAPGDMEELVVPDGHCYALGDNRGNSLDSRYYGPVPLASIEARATVIVRSPDEDRVGRRLSPP